MTEKNDGLGKRKDVSEADQGDDSIDASFVPTAVGTAVAVVNSKPVAALLVPAFTALGAYWGERMDENVERWRKKRQANVDEHVSRVVEVDGPPAESGPTEEQSRLSAAWETAAQTVDPIDGELALLWEAALGRILASDNDAERMMDALRSMTKSDAHLFLTMPESPKGYSTGHNDELLKFVRLGLLRRESLTSPFIMRLAILTGTMTVLSGVLLPLVSQAAFAASETFTATYIRQALAAIGPAIAVAFILGFILVIYSRLGRYELTGMGRRLWKSGRKYQATIKK